MTASSSSAKASSCSTSPSTTRPGIRARYAADDAAVLNFTEYRQVLEGGAAGFAAWRRTSDDLAAMEMAQVRLDASLSKHEARNADTAFHLAVAAAARNPDLFRAIEDVRMQIVGPLDLMRLEWIKEASFHGHQIILRAIKAGHREEAEEAMRNHVGASKSHYQQELDDTRIDDSMPRPVPPALSGPPTGSFPTGSFPPVPPGAPAS